MINPDRIAAITIRVMDLRARYGNDPIVMAAAADLENLAFELTAQADEQAKERDAWKQQWTEQNGRIAGLQAWRQDVNQRVQICNDRIAALEAVRP